MGGEKSGASKFIPGGESEVDKLGLNLDSFKLDRTRWRVFCLC